jgi:hypothetical protein
MNFDFLELFFFAWFCMWLGWKLREVFAQHMVNQLSDRLTIRLHDTIENAIPIAIERHENVFYVYNVDTNSFMTQGSTRKELERNLQRLFPDQIFKASEENMREVGFE